MNTEARSIGECYSSATESSDLRVRTETRGDVDLMIASGWTGNPDGTSSVNPLGVMLYRLQVEFDSVRAILRGTGPLNQIERYLILEKLRTLPPARRALGELALEHADRVGYVKPQRVLFQIMGRVLDVFLDPTCHHCDGRGFNGGTHRGEPTTPCRDCRQSGHRRDRDYWRDEAEHGFATSLLSVLDRRLAEVDRQMRRFLRQH